MKELLVIQVIIFSPSEISTLPMEVGHYFLLMFYRLNAQKAVIVVFFIHLLPFSCQAVVLATFWAVLRNLSKSKYVRFLIYRLAFENETLFSLVFI